MHNSLNFLSNRNYWKKYFFENLFSAIYASFDDAMPGWSVKLLGRDVTTVKNIYFAMKQDVVDFNKWPLMIDLIGRSSSELEKYT